MERYVYCELHIELSNSSIYSGYLREEANIVFTSCNCIMMQYALEITFFTAGNDKLQFRYNSLCFSISVFQFILLA